MGKFIFGLAVMILVVWLAAGLVAGLGWAKIVLIVLGCGVATMAAILGFIEARDGFKEVWRR